MKKILFIPAMLLLALLATAQNYDAVKALLTLNQFQKAREEFDKAMTNPKYGTKAEAYLLKANIYAALSMDKATQNTPQGVELTAQADEAFKKYLEMQPEKTLLTDPIYQN